MIFFGRKITTTRILLYVIPLSHSVITSGQFFISEMLDFRIRNRQI